MHVALLLAFQPTLLGIAAIVSAVSGMIVSVVAARRASKEGKEKADEDCLQRLRQARAEAEAYAQELHQLKMHLPPEPPDQIGGEQ